MARKRKRRIIHTTKKSKGNGASRHRATAAKKPARRVAALQKFLAAYGRGSEAGDQRERFAVRVGTSLPYLVHIGYGFRLASPKLAADIERHTHGLVTVEELRPDIDWKYLRRARAPINAAAR